jgi:hypothetical protein
LPDALVRSPLDPRLSSPSQVAIDLHYDLVFGLSLACSSNVTWSASVDTTALLSDDQSCYDYSYTRPFAIRFESASLLPNHQYFLKAYAQVDGIDRYQANCVVVTGATGEAVLPDCTVSAP